MDKSEIERKPCWTEILAQDGSALFTKGKVKYCIILKTISTSPCSHRESVGELTASFTNSVVEIKTASPFPGYFFGIYRSVTVPS